VAHSVNWNGEDDSEPQTSLEEEQMVIYPSFMIQEEVSYQWPSFKSENEEF
jgi:hypothetical protein